MVEAVVDDARLMLAQPEFGISQTNETYVQQGVQPVSPEMIPTYDSQQAGWWRLLSIAERIDTRVSPRKGEAV